MEVSVKGADISVLEKINELRASTSEDKRLLLHLEKAFDKLKQNPFYGDRVQKKRIPKAYFDEYHMDNLLIFNLPGAWRLVYFIERYGDNIIVVIVDFMSHTEYDRIFGYSRK
jgi:mRNA-degrading endonuclease HigB of HigAB toxin-antitoxin module